MAVVFFLAAVWWMLQICSLCGEFVANELDSGVAEANTASIAN